MADGGDGLLDLNMDEIIDVIATKTFQYLEHPDMLDLANQAFGELFQTVGTMPQIAINEPRKIDNFGRGSKRICLWPTAKRKSIFSGPDCPRGWIKDCAGRCVGSVDEGFIEHTGCPKDKKICAHKGFDPVDCDGQCYSPSKLQK